MQGLVDMSVNNTEMFNILRVLSLPDEDQINIHLISDRK